MLLQTRIPCELLFTYMTFEYGVGMSREVRLQNTRLSELLVADRARIWLKSCVDSHVFIQRAFVGERSLALSAFMWSLASMYTTMNCYKIFS